MNFIIFDLECTCWQHDPPGFVQEIIEIGAVKVNRYGEVSEKYDKFVKPVVFPVLSAFCKELTSITQENVNRAKTFPHVIETFRDWIDVDEEYLLCSWGNFDKKQLIHNAQYHGLEHTWMQEHINLKDQYKELKRYKNPAGLKKTVEKEGFEFEGIHHRGFDDAYNLAKVFIKYLDDWKY